MKHKEKTQKFFEKTLEFMMKKAETKEDLEMIQETIKYYEKMGYSIKSFKEKYQDDLDNLQYMLSWEENNQRKIK